MTQIVTSKPPFIFHFRRTENGYDWQATNASPLGGLTVVYDPESNTAAISRCSEKDRFQKRVGVNIALGRLKLYLHNSDSQPDWMKGFEGRSLKMDAQKRSINFNHLKHHYLTDTASFHSLKWNGVVRFGSVKSTHDLKEIREHVTAIAQFTAKYYRIKKIQRMIKDLQKLTHEDAVKQEDNTNVELPIYKKPVLTEIQIETKD